MDRRRVKGWGIAALVFAALCGGAWSYGHWAFYNLPVFQFRPVCNDHDRTKRDFHFLHLVWGEPTQEFWDLIIDYYYPHRQYGRYNGGTVEDGKMYVSADYFFPLDIMNTKFSQEFAEEGYFPTRTAAYEIYQRRMADGRITDATMAPYRTEFLPKKRPAEKPEYLKYDECGFIEKLIIRGGNFAAE